MGDGTDPEAPTEYNLECNVREILAVSLTEKEQELERAICWDLAELGEAADRQTHLERTAELAELLIARNAIPKVRLAYFDDPQMNIGGYGKSRRKKFERNGTAGRDIWCHPHFVPYLRYFIHGPDLPSQTIGRFCSIIEEHNGTFWMLLEQVLAFVREEIRAKCLEPGHAAEEFFKLAQEIGQPKLALPIRSAAKGLRVGIV
jgi:hypothetical protein